MVRKGEYLERAVVIPGMSGTLEGLFHRGALRPPMLIAPDLIRGSSMESPMIAELAWAVTRRGHPTLRFNYRGVGASTRPAGAIGDEQSALEDLASAAEHLRNTMAHHPLAIAGIGSGGSIAAKHALVDQDIELLV